MILSDRDIRKRLDEGSLVVEPLEDPDLQIQPASIDLRLGQEFLEFQRTNISCIHPKAEREVAKYVSETRIDAEDEFILHPNDFVLGTTLERVEIPSDLIAHVQGRSSLGRLAVVIHASLPYDEEVFLWTPEDGFGFHEIGAIVEHNRPAFAVSFDPATLRIGTHKITDYIRNPQKRIYRITLESGREVRVTRDHNLFTLDEQGAVTRIPSEEAQGQKVMVPGTLPSPSGKTERIDLLDRLDPSDTTVFAADGSGTGDSSAALNNPRDREKWAAQATALSKHEVPDDASVAVTSCDTAVPRHLEVTPEFGWVLGYAIVDGVLLEDQLVVTDAERANLERFGAWFEQFDAPLSWSQTEHGRKLIVNSELWATVFHELIQSDDGKRLPDAIWNWPDEVLEALYDGLLAGQGRQKDTHTLLETTSRPLADRVLYLGARLGRAGSIEHRGQHDATKPSESTEFETHCRVATADDPTYHPQLIPTPSDLLQQARRAADLDRKTVAKRMSDFSSATLAAIETGESNELQPATLRRLSEIYGEHGANTKRLQQILDGDIRFERVESVEMTDRIETTYDLEVQPNGREIENFLGGSGGIFLSNTAGIVDPGYRGQITLELSNLGTAPVALTPGMRISQVLFTQLSSPAERPYGSDRGSKYQDQAGPQASRIQSDEEFDGESS